MAKLVGFLVAVAVAMSQPAAAQVRSQPEPIRYTLRFPAPQTHYVEVAALVQSEGRPAIRLMMAVWTPGSYLVREYERHVEGVAAEGPDGKPLAVAKTEKNVWSVATGGAAFVTVRYRVYGREMGVRSNWIESEFAMLNGAPTFLTLDGTASGDTVPRRHEVTIEMPAAWKRSMTGLSELPEGPHRYYAPDFDTLVDSPIVLGNPDVHEFMVAGKRHYLVNTPATPPFDGARAAKDLERLVQEHLELWGSLPYDKYLFLNMIVEAGGGLEHRNSTLLMTNRWTTRTRKAYLSWLELCSHEFFHTWNVKRLRPVELGPFDYDEEVYTRSLWVAEG